MKYLGVVLAVVLFLGIGLDSGLSTATFAAGSSGAQMGTDAVGPLRLLTVYKSVSAGGSVMGRGITCGTDCTQYFSSGTVVNLTAKAASGYKFTGWSGCSYSTTATIGVVMSSNKSCTAKFKKL